MYNPALNAANLSNLKAELLRLRIELPVPMIEEFDAAMAGIAALEAPSDAELVEAIGKALDAGKDAAQDKTVLTLLARQSIAAPRFKNQLNERALEAHRVAVVNFADSIVEVMRAIIVEDADEAIQAAVKRNPREHDRRNDEPHVRIALEQLETVLNVWTTLAQLADVRSLSVETRCLILADPHEDEVTPGNYDAMTAPRLGRPVHLATLDEFEARVKARLNLRASLRAKAERAQQDAVKKAYGYMG